MDLSDGSFSTGFFYGFSTLGNSPRCEAYNLLNLLRKLVGTTGFEPVTTTPPV